MANPIAFLTSDTFSFEGEGDFLIENNDLKMIRGSLNVRIMCLKDLIRTDIGDYFYLKNLGANQDRFLGRGIDKKLELEVVEFLKNAIIYSQLFDESEFNIYSIASVNSIFIRIFINEGGMEEKTINLTYEQDTGVYLD